MEMADKAFTQADVKGLAAKLNAVDFTDGERSVLEAVLRAAAREGEVTEGEEVEGFDFNFGSLQPFFEVPSTDTAESKVPSARVPRFSAGSLLKQAMRQ